MDPWVKLRLLDKIQGTARLHRPGVGPGQYAPYPEDGSCSSRQKGLHYREVLSMLASHTDPAEAPLESRVDGFDTEILKMTSLQARRRKLAVFIAHLVRK
jgi:hypothetical protein